MTDLRLADAAAGSGQTLASGRVDGPLRVLAWPAPGPADRNPYTAAMYTAFTSPAVNVIPFTPLARGVSDADVFHLQWPEGIFEGRTGGVLPIVALKAWRVVRTARRVRRRGGVVALTVHNLTPHAGLSRTQAALWGRYHRRLLAEVTLLIGLTSDGLEQFRALHPAARDIDGRVVPHPHYRDAYPAPPEAGVARARLGLPDDARILGVLGSLRASKQTPESIAAFRAAARGGELLLIAGQADDEHMAAIERARDGDPRVRVLPGVLGDLALIEAFAAIDVCLINQVGTLNSGTALLALSMDRQVIAPSVGALPELRDRVGATWMALFSPPLDGGKLRELLDALPPRQGRVEALDALSPGALSAQLLEAFASRVR